MEKKLLVNTDNITLIKSDGWDSITSCDFGGKNVTFSGQDNYRHPFRNNTTITSITNCNITNNDGYLMFFGCSNLETFNCDLSNCTRGEAMFSTCYKLSSFTSNLSSIVKGTSMFWGCSFTSFTSDFRSLEQCNMFQDCSQLANVEIIVKATHSGWTQSDFSIPSTAPCNAYRYVDEIGDGLVKITFTSEERTS